MTGQLWTPSASVQANHKLQLPIRLKKFMNGGYLPVYQHVKFISDMELHPKKRNPFVGRLIQIETHRYQFKEESNVEPLIQQHGHHLWFLKTAIGYSLNYEKLLGWLTHLPNLKSLDLTDNRRPPNYNEWDETRYLASRQQSFPPLPHLESLAFTNGNFKETSSSSVATLWFRCLVKKYSLQIRRLTIQVALWGNEYSDMFPNLTELLLHADCYDMGKKSVYRLLMTISSPKLYALQLEFDESVENHKYTWIFPIVSMRFLQLNSISIRYCTYGKGLELFFTSSSDPPFSIPLMKSLVLWNLHEERNCICDRRSYEWLSEGFPSLEYLKMSAFIVSDVDMTRLWKSLPKLREVAMKKEHDSENCYGFLRDMI